MNKKRILILITILTIFFVVPIFINNTNINNFDGTLKTSTTNYLFNGVEYDIELNDVYDDENYTKIYTGANFQTSSFNSTIGDWNTIVNDSVSPVNNTCYKSPSNTDVSMINGTFDNTDNMKVNDDSNSEFTSTKRSDYPATYSFEDDIPDGNPADWSIYEGGGCFVNVMAEIDGHEQVVQLYDNRAGTTDNAMMWNIFDPIDDGIIEMWLRPDDNTENRYIQLWEDDTFILGATMFYFSNTIKNIVDNNGNIMQPYVNDVWYHFKLQFDCDGDTYSIWIDEVLKADDLAINVDFINDVSVLRFATRGWGVSGYRLYVDAVGYDWDPNYNVGDNLNTVPAELNFTIDLNFNELDTSKLLALDVSSYHFTNISTEIIGNIYDYNSGTYTQMFSSSNIGETLNYFSDNSSVSDYLNASGNLRLYFTGTNSDNFKQIIDYIKVRFYYKMDLTHSIIFTTNGYWKYRWELIGSLQYTEWVPFEVVDPPNNFHAISESDYTTRWILQNSTLSPVEDFNDDINTDYWNFINSSGLSFTETKDLIGDSFVDVVEPNNNFGSVTTMHVIYDGSADKRTFVNVGSDYLTENASGNTNLRLYQNVLFGVNTWIEVNESESFDESTITWNNKPDADVNVGRQQASQGEGWKSINLGTGFNSYYTLRCDTPNGFQSYRSSEHASNTPYIYNYLYKNYFGSGYMYMQTDQTELIGLQSIDYTTHYNLSSGDYFEVDFQTSSDSEIILILLKDGVVNKTLTLSQSGNTNFDRHTAQISVSEELEFDQLKIVSTFEDTDNIKIYDIKTYKYIIVGDSADFYIGSHSTKSVYLTPYVYTLRIFEEGTKKIDINITINSGDTYYSYQPTSNFQCRLTLHSTEGINLDITDFHILVNRSNGGSYSEFSLLGNTFNVDEGSMIYFEVSDRFDNLINEFQQVASDYIDLELEVYQLQIKNLMEQQTTVDINSTQVFPVLSGELIEYILSKNYYEIGYYDMDNDYHQFIIYLDSNQAYELNRSKICFLSYADQQGNHLSFDNYKTYINGSMIYEQIFYEDAGDDVNITITDRYDFQVYSSVYSVVSGDNYIPITLTMYSLKVMSQQLCFNHINITRDPVYYESSMYWSEWIAPSEIIDFRLFAGYYKINLTNNEAESSSYYSYTLSGDDVLLIGSNNTIYNVLVNIANVNTTIGNQITNVQIDLTNQNSNINNSIINIDINLGNINSTLGNMLINIDLDITNIANNISALYTFTNNSFINLDNVINTSFIYMENNIVSINQSISNLVIGVSNDIYLINGTVSTMITQLETNLLLINISIDTALFDLGTTLNLIGSNITSNYILLNNSINLTNLNINDSRIAIINNLALINNTISTLISEVYSAVYLINNSIYTAVVDVGTYLSLVNNTINGNLSIVLQMNEFLTDMYQMTMFSELLNWTNIGINSTLLDSQIDVWEFINDYKNTSLIIELLYNDIIDNLTLSAQNTIDQYLPATNVSYRVWSVEGEEYLNGWVALPENRTVNFGFFEEIIPEIPDFDLNPIWLQVILIFLIFGGMIGFISYIAIRVSRRNKSNKKKLYNYINRGRDVEAEYYGKKATPF